MGANRVSRGVGIWEGSYKYGKALTLDKLQLPYCHDCQRKNDRLGKRKFCSVFKTNMLTGRNCDVVVICVPSNIYKLINVIRQPRFIHF